MMYEMPLCKRRVSSLFIVKKTLAQAGHHPIYPGVVPVEGKHHLPIRRCQARSLIPCMTLGHLSHSRYFLYHTNWPRMPHKACIYLCRTPSPMCTSNCSSLKHAHTVTRALGPPVYASCPPPLTMVDKVRHAFSLPLVLTIRRALCGIPTGTITLMFSTIAPNH